jgi:hypothetical protein
MEQGVPERSSGPSTLPLMGSCFMNTPLARRVLPYIKSIAKKLLIINKSFFSHEKNWLRNITRFTTFIMIWQNLSPEC